MTVVKLNVPVTKIDQDLTTAFQRFWGFCPKQYGIGDARRAWMWALAAADNDAEQIVGGMMRYAAWCKKESIGLQFILSPAKWLQGEHWHDVLEPIKPAVEPSYDRREALRESAAKGNRFSADLLRRDYGE